MSDYLIKAIHRRVYSDITNGHNNVRLSMDYTSAQNPPPFEQLIGINDDRAWRRALPEGAIFPTFIGYNAGVSHLRYEPEPTDDAGQIV